MIRVNVDQLKALPQPFDVFAHGESGRDAMRELVGRGLVPPIPVAPAGGTPLGTVIWGHRIVDAAEGVVDELPAVAIGEPPVGLVALALTCEGRPGTYTRREHLAIAELCRALGVIESDRRERVDPLVDPRRAVLDELATIMSIGEPVRSWWLDSLVDTKTACVAADLPREWIVRNEAPILGLTASNRRSGLRWASQILRRDGEDSLAPIHGQTSAGLLDRLRRCRYPRTVAIEDAAAEGADRLRGSGVRIVPPEGFDGDTFTARFSFRSQAEYARRLSVLDREKEHVDAWLRLVR
jgi:hypothetical protein